MSNSEPRPEASQPDHYGPLAPPTSLAAARRAWKITQMGMRDLPLDDAERSALTPMLRRRAVLEAQLNHYMVTGWPAATSGIVVALSAIVAPIGFSLLAQLHNRAADWAIIYISYVPLLIVTLIATSVVSVLLVDWIDETRPRGARTAILIGVVAILIGLAAYISYMQSHPSKINVAAVSAISIAFAFSYTVGFTTLVARAYKRRKLGTLTPTYIGSSVFYDQFLRLHNARRKWKNTKTRRGLVRSMSNSATRAMDELNQAVRLAGGDRNSRHWASVRAWHISRSLQSHQYELMQANTLDQYDRIVDELKAQAVGLAQGSWTLVEQADGPSINLAVIRSLDRFVPAALLLAMAIALPHVPGIHLTESALTTVRLSLLVPAILSLLPVGPPSRDFVTGAFKDALGKVK